MRPPAPPPGWQPDPRGPAPPPGHGSWRRERRPRWYLALLVAAALLVATGVGGCVAVVVVGGPCAIDLPPGDVGDFHVVDDGTAPVTLYACGDGTCRTGSDPEPIAAGGTATSSFELCSEAPIGVVDEAGFLRGCLVLPIGEDRPAPTFRVSQFGTGCAGAGDVRPRIS